MDENNNSVLERQTEAINRHGIFLQKAVRGCLEKIRNVSVLDEEYPVEYLGKIGSIDLLIESFATKTRFLIPLESKRAYSENKEWIFFSDPKDQVTTFTAFKGNSRLLMSLKHKISVCLNGLEIDTSKNKNNYDAELNPIHSAANQISAYSYGFKAQEIKERNDGGVGNSKDFLVLPLIVTNSKLSVCKMKSDSVDLSTGKHLGNIEKESVPWLILRHSFFPTGSIANHFSISSPYKKPAVRSLILKTNIAIITSSCLERLPEMLSILEEGYLVLDTNEYSFLLVN